MIPQRPLRLGAVRRSGGGFGASTPRPLVGAPAQSFTSAPTHLPRAVLTDLATERNMRTLFFAVLFATASLSDANAAGGCGAGFHRGPYGGCVANRGAVVVAPVAPVVVA